MMTVIIIGSTLTELRIMWKQEVFSSSAYIHVEEMDPQTRAPRQEPLDSNPQAWTPSLKARLFLSHFWPKQMDVRMNRQGHLQRWCPPKKSCIYIEKLYIVFAGTLTLYVFTSNHLITPGNTLFLEQGQCQTEQCLTLVKVGLGLG